MGFSHVLARGRRKTATSIPKVGGGSAWPSRYSSQTAFHPMRRRGMFQASQIAGPTRWWWIMIRSSDGSPDRHRFRRPRGGAAYGRVVVPAIPRSKPRALRKPGNRIRWTTAGIVPVFVSMLSVTPLVQHNGPYAVVNWPLWYKDKITLTSYGRFQLVYHKFRSFNFVFNVVLKPT